jgi:hypothetical protein
LILESSYSGGQIDITGLSIVNVETIQHDNATLLLTKIQSETLSFEGTGRKFIRVGNTIELSDSPDTFSGTGGEVVEGGRGDDSLSNIKTAVYSGHWADYNHGWATGGMTAMSGSYTVEHARGTPVDGKDTLNNVLEIQFADTARPIVLDDHFNQWMGWSAHTFVNYQLDAGTDKRVSARKDHRSDQDLFTSTLVPNSPMVVEGSTQFGANWQATGSWSSKASSVAEWLGRGVAGLSRAGAGFRDLKRPRGLSPTKAATSASCFSLTETPRTTPSL